MIAKPEPELLAGIRNAVRALIIRDEQILLLRKEGGGRAERFALPGGGQELGESLAEALKRECLEEIGTEVQIDELLYVADFFKRRDSTPPTRRHLVEFLFRCHVPKGYRPTNGHHPDKHQVAVVWVHISELSRLTLFPEFLRDCISAIQGGDQPRYLGIFKDHAAP